MLQANKTACLFEGTKTPASAGVFYGQKLAADWQRNLKIK
jgi:hypothetical protein